MKQGRYWSEQNAVPMQGHAERSPVSLFKTYLITMGEGMGWQCLPGNTLNRRQSPETGRSAVSLLPRCTWLPWGRGWAGSAYRATLWTEGSPQRQEGQQSHCYQDVPDYHEGGNRLAVLTGRHSEQKAVPRDRKVSSLTVTKMYLITMWEAIGWWYLPGNTLSRRQSPGTGGPQFHRYQDVPDYHGGGNTVD